MARREEAGLDRDLADLPADLRWREWMCRIEAVMFASASPVAREDLARVVGTGVSVDLLLDDLAVDMVGRPYEVAQVGAVIGREFSARLLGAVLRMAPDKLALGTSADAPVETKEHA